MIRHMSCTRDCNGWIQLQNLSGRSANDSSCAVGEIRLNKDMLVSFAYATYFVFCFRICDSNIRFANATVLGCFARNAVWIGRSTAQ